MKYVENGYKEISRGVYVKTYIPYEDGTPATDKQKTAIKNMRSYLECGSKTNHKCLRKKELKRIEKLTKVSAMKEIGTLIQDVKHYDNERNDWGDVPW